MDSSDRRCLALRAALAAVLVPAQAPELALIRRWLDSWTGIGLIAVGMQRQGFDVQLTAYGDGHWPPNKNPSLAALSVTFVRFVAQDVIP